MNISIAMAAFPFVFYFPKWEGDLIAIAPWLWICWDISPSKASICVNVCVCVCASMRVFVSVCTYMKKSVFYQQNHFLFDYDGDGAMIVIVRSL